MSKTTAEICGELIQTLIQRPNVMPQNLQDHAEAVGKAMATLMKAVGTGVQEAEAAAKEVKRLHETRKPE